MKDEIDNSAKLGYNGVLTIDIFDDESDQEPVLHSIIPRDCIANISISRIHHTFKNSLFEFKGLFRTLNNKGQEINVIIDELSATYMNHINEFMMGDFQILKLIFRSTGNKFKNKDIYEFQVH